MSICNLDHFAESYWRDKKFVLVGGAFDPLHEGHLAYFDVARQFGPLVCAVTTDAELAQKRTPLLPELTRLKVLNACSRLEHVHLAVHGKAAVIDALKPSHYVVGKDWKDRIPKDERKACERSGTFVVYADARENSSSWLLADFERRRNAEKLAAFEAFVQQQTPAEKPWEPVTDYGRETRREIEAPQARIIADLFGDGIALDVGCGSGYLVELLNEEGVSAFGMDIVPPDGARYKRQDISGHITTSAIPFNLVICREVLEHLTVTQLATAVRNLMRLSNKYVYITTRFTAASHLLDCDGSDGLDPTHITMLNQDLLRTLFVLEGCTRRTDLEQQLDWMKKGRVLVYEVPR